MDKTLINKKQLSEYLGMSMSKIDYLMKEDKIEYYKIGKNVRFNTDEIKNWVSKFKTPINKEIIDFID
jgi:excisionase family DNA binding protein